MSISLMIFNIIRTYINVYSYGIKVLKLLFLI